MSIDDIRHFELQEKKLFLIDVLHRQGVLSDDDMDTLRQAAPEAAQGRLTYAAVARWLNSKDGVHVSPSTVRNYLHSLS